MHRVFLRLLFLYLFRLKIGRCLARCNKREHVELLLINARHFVKLLLMVEYHADLMVEYYRVSATDLNFLVQRNLQYYIKVIISNLE